MQIIFPSIQRPLYFARRVQRRPGKWKAAQHLYMKSISFFLVKRMKLLNNTARHIFITQSPRACLSLHSCLHFYYYDIYRGKSQHLTCKHHPHILNYRDVCLKTGLGSVLLSGSPQLLHQNCKPRLKVTTLNHFTA